MKQLEPYYAPHLTPHTPGPRSDRVQSRWNWRMCVRCAEDRPAKGGKVLQGGMFECAMHQRTAV